MGHQKKPVKGRHRTSKASQINQANRSLRTEHAIATEEEVDPQSALPLEATSSKPGRFDLDNLSVASYESGDEDPRLHDGLVSGVNVPAITPFSYAELDLNISAFRILTLYPASNKLDDAHCTLSHAIFKTDAETLPEYEALSYAWGDAEEERVIYVNGNPFGVTPNLEVALRYLRKPLQSRVLWIDAICIDQKNLTEKSHQVSMMRDIYKNASRVLVWLGESDRDIRKAMALLKQAESAEHCLPTVNKLGSFISGLGKIFAKPWWSRTWVVQEIVVAKTIPLIGCGRKWVSWESFHKEMLFWARDEIGEEKFLQNPLAIVNLCLIATDYTDQSADQVEKSRSLPFLLTATCDRKTSQPHDKVFALLGLTADSAVSEIEIDYSQPLSLTYQLAMHYILKSGESMNFLIQAMNQKGSAGVPSWCVDFSVPNWNKYSGLCGWSPLPKYKGGASGKLPQSSILHNPKDGTLVVLGTLIGRINHLNVSECGSISLPPREKSRRTYLDALSHDEYVKLFKEVASCVLDDVLRLSHAARTALEVRMGKTKALRMLALGKIWETVMEVIPLDSHIRELPEKEKRMLRDKYSAFESFGQLSDKYQIVSQEWAHLTSRFPDSAELSAWAVRTICVAGLYLANHTLLTTDTGYLGRAPTAVNAIQEGDLLCIIHGCYVPVILRPHGNAYKVVTFSYVTDVMEGQYFDGVERETQRFTLC